MTDTEVALYKGDRVTCPYRKGVGTVVRVEKFFTTLGVLWDETGYKYEDADKLTKASDPDGHGALVSSLFDLTNEAHTAQLEAQQELDKRVETSERLGAAYRTAIALAKKSVTDQEGK